MEDQVPFKVYTFWEENGKPEVRRFGVEKSAVTSFKYFNSKLQDVYPGLKSKNYTVAWRDEEGDDILVSSDEEMVTAMTSLGTGLIRLFVNVKKSSMENDCKFEFTARTGGSFSGEFTPSSPQAGDSKCGANAKNAEEPVHSGVTCEVCEWPVVGFRYKCVICPDYDLCSGCEAAGNHREHCMVRLPAPEMSRTLIKAAIKRSRQFLKTVAHTDCPYKRQKGEKNERKQHEESHGRRSEHRQRRNRISWLDTFASYMNEFANLAGDVDVDIDIKASGKKVEKPQELDEKEEPKKEPKEKTIDESMEQDPKQEESKIAGPKPEQATQQAKNTEQPEAGVSGTAKPKMIELQKLLDTYVGSYYNSFTTPLQLQTASRKSVFVPITPDNKPGEASTPKSDSSSVSSNRDVSPDKADDWTVINSDKDFTGAFTTATAPADSTNQAAFNLPEEFKERVKIGEGSNLYPPLNTATAVLNPKEPELPKVQQPVLPAKDSQPAVQAQAHAGSQAQFSAQQQPQPTATQPQPAYTEHKTHPQMKTQPPTRYHSKPHIDAAIRCMLSMGFTNEGGWLTQLLESKDGNIAAVIDMLNPVTPKNQ